MTPESISPACLLPQVRKPGRGNGEKRGRKEERNSSLNIESARMAVTGYTELADRPSLPLWEEEHHSRHTW
ncbi:atp-binding cassette transporter [Moniliophthora roreri]|nr:atp-binding cassette transporter [Moniliophthora roreri]